MKEAVNCLLHPLPHLRFRRSRFGAEFHREVKFRNDKVEELACGEPMQQVVLAEIDRYLKPYPHHLPGEVYVFMDVATDGNRRAWARRVNGDGALSALEVLL